MKLKSNVTQMIKKSGYTREYIVEQMKKGEGNKGGVTLQTISNWCVGGSFPNAFRMFLLAKILNCKTDDLFELIDEESNSDKSE